MEASQLTASVKPHVVTRVQAATALHARAAAPYVVGLACHPVGAWDAEQRRADVELGELHLQAHPLERAHRLGQRRLVRGLRDVEVPLQPDAVERDPAGLQIADEREQALELGTRRFDGVVVDEELRARVGGVRGPQRLRDVVRADEPPPDGRRERAVRGDRLVDDVPLDARRRRNGA